MTAKAAPSSKRIFVTTHRKWEVFELTSFDVMGRAHFIRHELPIGRHELVRVHDPRKNGTFWLALASGRTEDRIIGMNEEFWRRWTTIPNISPNFRMDFEEV